MIISEEIMSFLLFLMEAIILMKYIKAQLTSKYRYEFSPLYAGIIALMGFLLRQIGTVGTPIFHIGIFILIYFSYLNTIQEKLVTLGTFLLLNMAIEIIVILLFISEFDISMTEIIEISFISLEAIVISKIILLLVITYLTHRKKNKLHPISVLTNKSMIIKIVGFVLIINFILFLVLNIYKTNPIEINDHIYLLLLSCATICFLSVNIYEELIKESENQIKLRLLLQQKEAEYKYNQEIAVTVDSVRAIKHDISNHLFAISAYIQCKENEKAIQYIEKIAEPIESINNLLNISHPVIASVLYVKTMLAEKNEIIFITKIDLQDEILIEDIDLTILLGNILDNAIESCEQVATQEKRIELSLGSKRNYFYIDCINTLNPKEIKYKANQLQTTKKDTLYHGVGLKNIQIVVDKYEGDKNITITDDEFKIKITLKNLK
ncbi:GHKL domain-containing protein [Alkalibaculum bacchi]|uniref:sensor histidine kinase n=1 Tax=Alkalibaculum bacchi TaxID=645887 RepID=UPI0026EB3AA8|nr:GHKL domain-containing protein [Alkalibaculum bacchi]